jgi:hypothetical protein
MWSSTNIINYTFLVIPWYGDMVVYPTKHGICIFGSELYVLESLPPPQSGFITTSHLLTPFDSDEYRIINDAPEDSSVAQYQSVNHFTGIGICI